MTIGTLERPLRVAIIGAGPAGFYTGEALLKQTDYPVSIDLFDRLPTPYGLVRYGVAPDHQKIKSITKLYERTCSDRRLRFFGHVCFGTDLTHEEMRRHYDAVVYTVGSPADRNLGIPGEALAGSLSATEFVAWYNGHPDYAALGPDLSHQHVAVIGMGNVAVDVARILAKSADELADTDIADHALEVLQESRVEEIHMLGRRGPVQAKFTTKELRELAELNNADLIVNPAELELDPVSLRELASDPMTAKNLEILQTVAARPTSGKPRRLVMRFLTSPLEILGTERVEALKLGRNRLEPTPDGYLNAVGTGETETLEVGMVLRSVGYRGVALPGIPFDSRRGIIPNLAGRVLDKETNTVLPSEYVAGWAKRGPTGVIGTNKADAMETVKALLADVEKLELAETNAAQPSAIPRLLGAKRVAYVNFADWLVIDALEREAGEKLGRPRVKLNSVRDMLEHCHPKEPVG